MTGNSTDPSRSAALGAIDMRTVPRHWILLRCFVQPLSAASGQPWRCIAFDVSVAGIGIALPIRLPRGTELSIYPWELPGAQPLRGRVAWAKHADGLWFTGCELLQRLSPADLKLWRGAPTDWVEQQEPQPGQDAVATHS